MSETFRKCSWISIGWLPEVYFVWHVCRSGSKETRNAVPCGACGVLSDCSEYKPPDVTLVLSHYELGLSVEDMTEALRALQQGSVQQDIYRSDSVY